MYCAIIPAHNEAENITKVLNHLRPCNLTRLIVVANGCQDRTEEKTLREIGKQNIELLSFPEPLGLDIPRAIGAIYAQQYQPDGLLFLDGDMTGAITPTLLALINGIKHGLDLALTNCYPTPTTASPLADLVLKYRQKVNKKLGVFPQLGLATPSHGPHALSANLLRQIPLEILAIPPLVLAFAVRNNFRVNIAASLSHDLLGSPLRDNTHTQKVAATIIRDCQQALAYLKGLPLREILQFAAAETTDKSGRRFDLLNQFLTFYPAQKPILF